MFDGEVFDVLRGVCCLMAKVSHLESVWKRLRKVRGKQFDRKHVCDDTVGMQKLSE